MPRPFILLSILLTLLSLCHSHQCILRDSPRSPAIILPDARINDDYCDCIDGSDETSTSACPNGTFTCLNKDFRPAQIPAAWVQDGACDCCDGSDEPANQCPNTCSARKKEAEKRIIERVNVVKNGIGRKRAYIKQAKIRKAEDANRLKVLQGQLKKVERSLEESKKRIERLRSLKQAVTPAVTKKPDEKFNAEREDDGRKYDYEGDDEDGDDDDDEDDYEDEDDEEEEDNENDIEEDDKNVIEEDQKEGTNQDDSIEDDEEEDYNEEGEEYDNVANKIEEESTNTESSSECTGEGKCSSASSAPIQSDEASIDEPSSESESSAEPTPVVNQDATCADLESRNAMAIMRKLHYFSALLLTKLHRLAPRIFRVPASSAISSLETCIQRADTAKHDLQTRQRELQKEVDDIQKRTDMDYGAHEALRKLHGECVKAKIGKYEFDHCVFDVIRQYEHGNVIATLGKFEGWEDGMLKYGGGDKCWNGPQRSVMVKLECGEKEDIVHVEEAKRCSYEMRFRTAAVCEQGLVEKIKDEL